jgi:CubicO group peptidase (beta-lactamase class C family)
MRTVGLPTGGGGAQWSWRDGDGTGGERVGGVVDRRTGALVTPSTTFHGFSTTKPITALAVLQLAAQGRIDLEAPLRDALPELPYANGATIAEVLTHQAGLPNPIPVAWAHRAEDHAAFDEDKFIADVLASHPRAGPAGVRVSYSNVGYLLLGRLIARVRGVPYATAIREHVLQVVLASHACGSSEDKPYLDFDLPAVGHAVAYTALISAFGWWVPLLPDPQRLRTREGLYIRYAPFHLHGAAYGGIKGNAAGFMAWLTAAARRDERLLPRAWWERMFAPTRLRDGRPTGLALGWFTGRLGDDRWVHHPGGGPGYYAETRIYPDREAASVLLTSTTAAVDRRLLDRLDSTWLTVNRGRRGPDSP